MMAVDCMIKSFPATGIRHNPSDGGRINYHSASALESAALVSFAVITASYFYVRIPLMNPDAPIFSALLLSAELFGLVTLLLHAFTVWTLVDREPPAPAQDAVADIFITTWNEPVDMLRNTLLAARQVRLVRHVWLLDDGARPEMRTLAAMMGVKYLSRTDRSHAKAGNLNNALKHTDAEFVAQFDCDHAPSPEFFERTLGYFKDERVAFVQTPQDFYNIDSFQHRSDRRSTEFWHEQTLFYKVIQPGKDRWNAAFFCGSCAVVRKAALDDIGGFATGTITEDIHTSLRVHKRGWKSVYHTQSLAFGLAPANHDQYETQRLRWGRGAMQVWRKEGILFRPGLTIAQRLCYLASVITYFEGWQKAVLYFTPMAVLATGVLPIVALEGKFLILFLLWILSGLLVNESFGRSYTKTVWMEEYNCLRYLTFMNATITLFIPFNWRFKVTPKSLEAQKHIPLRLVPQAAIIIGAITAFFIGTFKFTTGAHLPFGTYVANATWAIINAIIAARALTFSAGKAGQRRVSHRFSVPTLVILDLPGGKLPVIADDLSAGGMKFQVLGPSKLPRDICGRIILPNGVLKFSGATVDRRRSSREVSQGVSVKFDKLDSDSLDRLNACLFGNELQWALNDWRETNSRDVEPLELLKRRGKREPRPVGRGWRFCRLKSNDGSTGVDCLFIKPAGKSDIWRVVSYSPPPGVHGLRLYAAGEANAEEGLAVLGSQTFSVGGGRVYLIALGKDGASHDLYQHNSPAWRQSNRAAA